MSTKWKSKHITAFMMTVIVCLVMFICPAYAVEGQGADEKTVDDTVTAVQEESPEESDEQDPAEAEITAEADDENAILVDQEAEETAIPDQEADAESVQGGDTGDAEAVDVQDTEAADDQATETEPAESTEESETETETETETKEPEPFARPVKDGTYVIVSKTNGFKALQTEGGSTAAGKQIELQECDGSNTQKFKLVSDAKTGYYTITNVQSGKILAVKGDTAKAGTAVVQNAASSTLGQKWILVEKSGYYEIQSALDGSPLVLTLKNASTANGTDAVLEKKSNAASQLFSFLVSKSSVTISDGVYEISTALNSNMKLDIYGADMYDKGNLQIYKSNGTDAQRFIVSKISGNQYTMTSYHSGKAVDLNAGSKSAKTNVHQYTKNGTAAQKWTIRNAGDGTLYITSAVSGLPLEVSNTKAANNTNIYVNKASGSKAQKFTFTRIADSKLKPIAEGVYLIKNSKNTSRVIAVEDGSRLQRANIQLQYNDSATFQKFKFIYAGNGYYKIQNVKSKHMIDLKDGSYANKANIQQWHDNGNVAQLWLPHKNGNGTYTFISAKSSKVLDVANGSTADGANIWVYAFNNTDAQKYQLTKTSGSDSTAINNGTVSVDSVLAAMLRKAQDYSSSTNYLVLCNITNHRLVLFKASEGRWLSVMDSPVSVGKASTPTPTGTFTVYNHWKYFDGDYNDSRLTYQCWWSTCFYGSYYFHSVLYDYNSGYPGNLRDGRMAVNVSHGCVRMPLDKAKYLYDHSPIGTKVRVYK